MQRLPAAACCQLATCLTWHELVSHSLPQPATGPNCTAPAPPPPPTLPRTHTLAPPSQAHLPGLCQLLLTSPARPARPAPPHRLTSLSLELFDTLFKYGLEPLAELPGLACLRLSLHWTQAPHCTVELPTPPALTSLHLSSGSYNSTQGHVVLKVAAAAAAAGRAPAGPLPSLASCTHACRRSAAAASTTPLQRCLVLPPAALAASLVLPCPPAALRPGGLPVDSVPSLPPLQPMPKLQSLRLVLHQASCGASLSALLESTALGKLRLLECHTIQDGGLATLAQLTRWGPWACVSGGGGGGRAVVAVRGPARAWLCGTPVDLSAWPGLAWPCLALPWLCLGAAESPRITALP
jgi:hypothetical protein